MLLTDFLSRNAEQLNGIIFKWTFGMASYYARVVLSSSGGSHLEYRGITGSMWNVSKFKTLRSFEFESVTVIRDREFRKKVMHVVTNNP